VSRPVAAGEYRRREEIERARDGEEREEEPSSFTDSLFQKCNSSQFGTDARLKHHPAYGPRVIHSLIQNDVNTYS
jgi:hypothetical protein